MDLNNFTLGDLIGWLTDAAIMASALTVAFDKFVKPLISVKKNSDKAVINAETISKLKEDMWECNEVILNAILAILEHTESSNHTGELAKAKKDIIDYLTHWKTRG